MLEIFLRTGLILSVLALWAADSALASGSDTLSNDKHAHRGPPPEAVEACEGLEEGDDCSFNARGHSIEGTCRFGRSEDDPLACMPSRPPKSKLPPDRNE